MAFDVDAALAAGYSKEEIDAYLQGRPDTKVMMPVAPGQETAVGEPPAPPTSGFTPAGEGNFMPGLATAALGAAQTIGPAAGIAAAAYGLGRYGPRAMEALKNFRGQATTGPMVSPIQPSASTAPAAGAQRIPITYGEPQPLIQQPPASNTRSPAMQTAMQQARTGAPAMSPTATPAPNPAIASSGGMPVATPAAQEAQQISRANQIVRALALDKVMKMSAGTMAAAMPSNIGQNYPFPTSGPFAGQEINPMTRRPWTRDELARLGR